MRRDRAVADIVTYDEGTALNHPLRLEKEVRHLGFGQFLLMSTVLAGLLAVTGLEGAQSNAFTFVKEIPVSAGVQTMSAPELVHFIKTENRAVFWLKAKKGDSYTISSSANGIDQIVYRPVGAQVSNLNQFEFNVGTYRDYSTYDEQPHPLLGTSGVTIILASGATLTYNSTSQIQSVVQFPNRPEVVVLNYPATQAVPTMINDAENLVPVS